jgi:hypothetical protein
VDRLAGDRRIAPDAQHVVGDLEGDAEMAAGAVQHGHGPVRCSGQPGAECQRAAEQRTGLALGHQLVLPYPDRAGPGPGPVGEQQVVGLATDQVTKCGGQLPYG